MMRRHLLTGLITVSLVTRPIAGFIQPAFAITVFDPSNYAQNVLTAARSLEQINNQIQSLQNQATMLQNMARNLERLDFSSLGQLTGALNRIDGLMIQADGLSFDLDRLEDEWREQYPESYDATIKVNDLAAAARERWQSAMKAFRQTMRVQSQIVENVQADGDLLADLVSRSQGAVGALQVSQATNQLIALSAKQQMQIQTLLATQYRAQAEDAARKAQSEEAARETTRRFLGSGDAYSGN
ncbi:P-type conjugative transfer protein TrbJ [Chelativorans sp. M5D2P16]|uniref:P-type conjugative transfer protein TrbJ n=1 Tax=Chelativorans sp. M5D2P16 TaxID=3095678 RepID=UPI002ACAF7B1|nr:P-type conjugative transfer protein TrbJ [Chelativorans sp. M5D2P16]MDZ5698652.1 P-type conjugative transfer protein TrbJ [Chelativorans sp. M5D2P16]